MDLDSVRSKIDQIDRDIITKLNERVRLASEVARVKHEQGLPIYHPEREEQVFAKLQSISTGPLGAEAIRRIYREIISAMIALEKKLVIAYLGPEATYTEQAARKNFGSSLDFLPLATIADVFVAVEKGEADYGVVPIENSTGGAVNHSLDMLVDSDLKIINQVYLRIDHCLISNSPLEAITEVHSKDQALLQCRSWLSRHLPHAVQVDANSTASAVRKAGEVEGIAAIASEIAAERYNVPIVARAIQERADNVTRFLVIARHAGGRLGNGKDKTSIVISINDDIGALERAIHPLSSRGINMTKIESRPSRRKAWDYLFFIDFCGHWDDEIVQEAVGELKQRCPMVKWLGSYPNVVN